MPTPVNSLLVLVASPGDAMEERATVRDEMNDWSVNSGLRQGVVLLPWLYERHAVAQQGGRAQALINAQAVDQADIVVAFFDSRLGTHTGVDVSGTAEEIRRADKQGKRVHVYFSDEKIARNVDPMQLAALQEFQAELREDGLLGNYKDLSDLAGQVTRAIQRDIDELGWGQDIAATTTTGARLVWEHVHEREQTGFDKSGKLKFRSQRNHLVVRNESDTDAVDLTFAVTPADDEADSMVRFEGPQGPVTLHARSELQWSLISVSSVTLRVDAQWTENGLPRTQSRTITTR